MRPHTTRRAIVRLMALGCVVLACDTSTVYQDVTPPPPPTTPSIHVQLGAGTLSIAQGRSGTVGITVARAGGFSGAVALAVSGAPPGVTPTLSPATLISSASTSTLTLASSTSAAPGTYTLTVLASGTGASSGSAALVLTISPASPATGSIELSLGAEQVTITLGETETVPLTVSRAGDFDGPIALDVAGAPIGLSATVRPNPVSWDETSGSLALVAASAAEPGTYTLTITARGAGVDSRTASLAVTIAPPAGGYIGVRCLSDDGMIYTVQGDSWTWGVEVVRGGGFTGAVELTIEGVPPSVNATFAPWSLDGATTRSVLTLTAQANALPFATEVLIRAHGAGVADAFEVVRLVVFPPAP